MGISACRTFNNTRLVYVAFSKLLSTQEFRRIFFKTEDLYFG